MKTKIEKAISNILRNNNYSIESAKDVIVYSTDFEIFTTEPVKGIVNYIGVLRSQEYIQKKVESKQYFGDYSKYSWYKVDGSFIFDCDFWHIKKQAKRRAELRKDKLTADIKPNVEPVTIFNSKELVESEMATSINNTPIESNMKTPLLNTIQELKNILADVTLPFATALTINNKIDELKNQIEALTDTQISETTDNTIKAKEEATKVENDAKVEEIAKHLLSENFEIQLIARNEFLMKSFPPTNQEEITLNISSDIEDFNNRVRLDVRLTNDLFRLVNLEVAHINRAGFWIEYDTLFKWCYLEGTSPSILHEVLCEVVEEIRKCCSTRTIENMEFLKDEVRKHQEDYENFGSVDASKQTFFNYEVRFLDWDTVDTSFDKDFEDIKVF